MNVIDLVNLRLNRQHLAATKFQTVSELVAWMGALQAQDYAMMKWAVGIRLPGSTEQMVETALVNGDMLRTHVLRPTWHIVSAADIGWMRALTAPYIKATLKSRHLQLELSDAIVTKSQKIIETVLRDGVQLTREELAVEFKNAQIPADSSRIYHLIFRAELDGLVCSGATKEGKPTYALLAERVPHLKTLTKEEALAQLARTYFASRGPATLQDFVWWSGLPVKDAKHALKMVQAEFLSETIASQTYWLSPSMAMPGNVHESMHFLPAFDEFLISYTDRSAVLPCERHTKTVFTNGVFRPVIVVNGQVVGIWKRTFKKDTVIVETGCFTRLDPAIMGYIEHAAHQLGHFLEKKTEIYHNLKGD